MTTFRSLALAAFLTILVPALPASAPAPLRLRLLKE